MGKLAALTIPKPGHGGLNTQETIPADELALAFASVATNGVVSPENKLAAREDFVLQTSGFSAGTVEQIYLHTHQDNTQTMWSACAGQLYTGISSLTSRLDYRSGRQMVDVGGAKTGASATGLANDGTSYTFLVSVDGAANTTVNVTGSAAQTYTNLLTEINADLTGATASIVAGNLEIKSSSTGASSSIAITAGGGGTALLSTLTNYSRILDAEAGTTDRENWQFASLNGEIMAVQAGNRPRVWAESDFATETAITSAASSSHDQPNCVLAAFGRFWIADDAAAGNQRKIWWSNLLTADFTGGDAGSLDLTEVWPDGSDRIVALGAVSSRLVIFGRNSIVMYSLPADLDPANMTLLEPIKGIGCVARDSVVNADGQLFFLSDQGVMNVERLSTIASMATTGNATKLVQDEILTDMASETMTSVRAGWQPAKSWYVLTLPTANKTYCVNLLNKQQDGTPRITVWTNASMPFRGFAFDKSGNWYCGGINGVFKYTGYTSDGAPQAYTFTYWTPWITFGDESHLKHLKTAELVLKAGSGQAGTLYWRTDYIEGTTHSLSFTCSSTEFAEDPGIGRVRLPIGRSCKAVKFGVAMTIAGDPAVLHSMKIYVNRGKVA